MSARSRLLTFVGVLLVALAPSCTVQQRQALIAVTEQPATTTTTTPPPATRRPDATVAAFCGPTTSHPAWRVQMATLADIGVTAVHGYCYTPPAGYTVLDPGSRYASQAEYLELAGEASRLGLGVIAYDPQFWTDPTAAAAVWAPFIADGTLVGVDLGDEPGWSDMAELNRRAAIVRTAGVEPQLIFVGGHVQPVADQHAAVPTICPTSDDYESNTRALDDLRILLAVAGCAGIAIDTTGRDMDRNGDRWSTDQIAAAQQLGARITLFTGVQPENFPTWDALVDANGHITPAGAAVKEALQ